jgi:hypothetical protein
VGTACKLAPTQVVNIIRDGEAQPLLRVELVALCGKVTDLPAGSVWFRLSLLAATAPAPGYTGLPSPAGR